MDSLKVYLNLRHFSSFPMECKIFSYNPPFSISFTVFLTYYKYQAGKSAVWENDHSSILYLGMISFLFFITLVL